MTIEASSLARDGGPRVGQASWRMCLLVVLLAVAVRGGAMWALRGNLAADPDAYQVIARHLLQEGNYARGGRLTAYRPPLYPLVLAALGVDGGPHSPWRVALLHLMLGAATVGLVFHMARPAGTAAAWAAAAIVLFDPLLLHQQSLVMTETLAAFLVAATLWVFTRGDAAAAPWTSGAVRGACFGLAILCRPTFLVWWGLCWVVESAWRPRNWRCTATMIAATVLLLTPWTVRNWICLGKPIFATTHGGYTFWLANNDGFYDFLEIAESKATWDSSELDRRHVEQLQAYDFDEVRTDRFCYQQAWETIRRRPADFAWATLIRVGRFWRPAPHASGAEAGGWPEWLRWAVGGWYLAGFAAASWAWKTSPAALRNAPYRQGGLLAIALTLVHAFFWSNMRMRAPLTPWLALLVGLAWQAEQRAGRRRVV